MRAARLDHPGDAIRVVELPEPTPGPGQVVIKVAAGGVCHSDLTIQKQGPVMPPAQRFPLIPGHEIAGYIHAMAEGVTGYAVGDAVGIYSGWGDRTCVVCRSGYEHLCPNIRFPGVVVDGGWADYMVIPHADYLIPLGDLDPVLAAPLADAGLTAFGGVSKVLPLLTEADSSVMVIGPGGLGQFAIKYLAALTPATIIALDIEESKRAKAVEIGASYAFDSRAGDVADQVRNVTTDKLGVTAVIDFVGIDDTLSLAASVVVPRGRITLIGINGGSLPFGYGTTQQEVQLSTSTLGTRDDMRQVIRLARENGINAEITRYDLADVNQALADLAARKIPERAALIL
jgi:alcohol dehydrogenase, propanol-preferring